MTVGEVVAKLKLDMGEFRSGLSRANTLLAQHRETALRASAVLAGFGAGIGAGLLTATRAASEFEAEMRNVNSILKVSEAEFRSLSASVLALARTTGKAPADLARGLYDIASSGFDGAEGLMILEASARAATAGLTDTATSVKAATAVLNAYRMEASEVDRVQDVLFKTVERGVITYGELAMNLGDVVSAAAQAKVPIEEIGAAVAALTKAGVQPAEAFTSLNQILLSFIRPTDQAKAAAAALGIDLSATALASRGLAGVMVEMGQAIGAGVGDLDRLVESGASEAEVMEAIAQQAGISTERLAELFPNVRALRGALVLAAEGGRVFQEEIGGFADVSGATLAAFEEQGKSFQVQWSKTWAGARAVMVQFGTAVLPLLKTVTSLLGLVVRAGEAVPAPLRTLIAVAALLATGLFSLSGAVIFYKAHLADAVGLTGKLAGALLGLQTQATATATGVAAAAKAGGPAAFFGASDARALQAARVGLRAVGAEALTTGAAFRAAGVAVKGFFASMGPIGWIILGITGLATAWGLYRQHVERAAQQAREQAEQTREQSRALDELLPKLQQANRQIEAAQTRGVPVPADALERQTAALNELSTILPTLFTYDERGNAVLQEQADLLSEHAELRRQAAEETKRQARAALAEHQQQVAVAKRAVEAQQELLDRYARMQELIEGGSLRFSRRQLTDLERQHQDAQLILAERAGVWREAIANAERAQQAADAVAAAGEGMVRSDEERAARQARLHQERVRLVDGEVAALRRAGVDSVTLERYATAARLLAARDLTDKQIALIADVLEAQGRALDAGLLRARAAYAEEVKLAEDSAQARLLAERKLAAEVRAMAREAAMDRLRENETQLRRIVAQWQGAAEALVSGGRLGRSDQLRYLERVLSMVRQINELQGKAGLEPLFGEEELRLAQTIHSRYQEMVESLREKERSLHQERLQWARTEREERTRLHRAEMDLVQLRFERERDLAIVSGRENEVARARRSREELAALQEIASEVELSGEALFEQSSRQVELAKQAVEGGALSRKEAATVIAEAYTAMERARTQAGTEQAADFARRRAEYERTVRELTEGVAREPGVAGLRDQLARLPQSLLESIGRTFDELERRVAGLLSSVPAVSAVSLPAAVAGGPAPMAFHITVNGERVVGVPSKVRQLAEEIGELLLSEHERPRN